jgi:hypothetical protein
MVQAGEELGFALEAGHAFRVSADSLGKDLDGDLAFETGVAGAVHFAHSPDAEQADDLVSAETCTRRDGHIRVSGLYTRRVSAAVPTGNGHITAVLTDG